VKEQGDGGGGDALGYGEIAGFVAEHFSVERLQMYGRKIRPAADAAVQQMFS
jgi:hypothetical protein